MGAAEREATGPQPAALRRDTPAPHCPCLECVLCTRRGPGPTGHFCWEAATLILGRSCISVRQELSPFPSRRQSLHPGGGLKSWGAECFKPSVFPYSPSLSRAVTCHVLVASRGWWLQNVRERRVPLPEGQRASPALPAGRNRGRAGSRLPLPSCGASACTFTSLSLSFPACTARADQGGLWVTFLSEAPATGCRAVLGRISRGRGRRLRRPGCGDWPGTVVPVTPEASERPQGPACAGPCPPSP